MHHRNRRCSTSHNRPTHPKCKHHDMDALPPLLYTPGMSGFYLTASNSTPHCEFREYCVCRRARVSSSYRVIWIPQQLTSRVVDGRILLFLLENVLANPLTHGPEPRTSSRFGPAGSANRAALASIMLGSSKTFLLMLTWTRYHWKDHSAPRLRLRLVFVASITPESEPLLRWLAARASLCKGKYLFRTAT